MASKVLMIKTSSKM